MMQIMINHHGGTKSSMSVPISKEALYLKIKHEWLGVEEGQILPLYCRVVRFILFPMQDIKFALNSWLNSQVW